MYVKMGIGDFHYMLPFSVELEKRFYSWLLILPCLVFSKMVVKIILIQVLSGFARVK